MNSGDVLAVVVSFNGGYKTVRTVNALLGRVGHVRIVDNGSGPESRDLLYRLQEQSGVSLTLWADNRGVGAALNEGLLTARRLGYSWLLTMDQDSIVDDAMIEAFCDAVRRDSSLTCLTPVLLLDARRSLEGTATVDYAITSGNLVRLDLFDDVGYYDEGLFIDCIDFDFSLRVRAAGSRIVRVGGAFLHHELGDSPSSGRWLARSHTYHSPLRRYYIYRNYLYIAKRYLRRYPYFVMRATAAHLLQLFSIVLLGKERASSFVYIWRGVRDYFLGISGPYQGRS